ncbi:hypothetical protein GCM10010992_20610 [Cloacibacterium rupense]|uniref:Uncharacterized protein n=1 Tax=Cloacibacterium rupense TaxID=517423 RepID=A0ABQ2NKM1_9FLAO|nr:hypothetical protein [Cloacibacterium rupense]GGP05232.1 hypothetical protein GCM10010992_20610 [Cloacibacterium rupense]
MGIFKNLFGNKKITAEKEKENETNELNKVYTKSIRAFFEYFENPDLIQDKIFEITQSNDKTTLIYLFIPYFFTRKIIPEVQWTDYYNIQTEEGKITSHKFNDSITLMELKDNIDENWQEYIGMDLNKILFHSGDFRAINEMMHKGLELENLEAVAPTIMG